MSDTSVGNGISRARQGISPAGRGPSRTDPSRPSRRLSGRALTLIAFAVPSLFLLVLLNVYPVLYGAFQTVHDGTLIS